MTTRAPSPEPPPPPRIQARRHYGGPAFLKQGFRPFFLAAGLWSALAMGLWLGMLLGGYDLPSHLPPLAWHAHEMLFGFAAAAMAGFLLTAVPNWTGRLPVRGARLGWLAALWLAGRVALLTSEWIGPFTAALIDSAFLLLLFLLVGNEILAGRNWRNLRVLAVVGTLALTNLAFHAEDFGIPLDRAMVQRLALMAFVVLIAIIGGRIVPSFTRNWLAKRGETHLPAPWGTADLIAMGTLLAAALAWVLAPFSLLTAGLATLAALANAYRLSRWRGLAGRSEPLILILHVGYGWLVVGLLAMAITAFWDSLPPALPIHSFATGAIAVMILAVMTRASRGHSGRPLTADAGTSLVYGLANLAALFRLAAAWLGEDPTLHLVSGLLWIVAFGLFVVLYLPMFFSK